MAICVVLRDGPLRSGGAADLRWEDVTFQASGARGALLTEVRRSKTCLALRPAYLDPQALVFGISYGQVGRRVRATALHAGTELTDLQNAGRWQSPSMPARYSKGQRASRGAVAKYYGDDFKMHVAGVVGCPVGKLVVHSSPFSGERNAPGVCLGSVCASANDDFGC